MTMESARVELTNVLQKPNTANAMRIVPVVNTVSAGRPLHQVCCVATAKRKNFAWILTPDNIPA